MLTINHYMPIVVFKLSVNIVKTTSSQLDARPHKSLGSL